MLQPDPHCPLCGGKGYIAGPGADAACPCIMGNSSPAGNDSLAGIPERYRQRSFANFSLTTIDQRRVLKMVKDYVDQFRFHGPAIEASELTQQPVDISAEKNSLLLTGDVGTGKTHLAVAALREIMAKGHTGLYWNVSELFRAIRAGFQEDEGDSDILEDCAAVDVLLLDDLGTHRNTDFVIDRLYTIVNRRYDTMRPIIATTNLGLTELFEDFDKRIASRLFEMSFHVQCLGGDYRLSAVERQRGAGRKSSHA